MNATNLNIVLTNSLCCISAQAAKVSKLYSIGSKCVESELQKLKLMNDWFEALRCYNANDTINSKFILRGNAVFLNTVSDSGRTYIITVNGVEYSLQGDNTTLVVDLIATLMSSIPEIISFTVIEDPDGYDPRFAYLYIEANCDITTINYQVIRLDIEAIIADIDFTLYQTGLCTITNCLTETQFNTMVHKLMNACDICDSQLTQ